MIKLGNYSIVADDNFLDFCFRNYLQNLYEDKDDLIDDLITLRTINRSLERFYKDGQIDIRLVINQIVILNNLFGPDVVPVILFHRTKYHSAVKTILEYMKLMPGEISILSPKIISSVILPCERMKSRIAKMERNDF